MPRGAEGERTVRRATHTGHTRTKKDAWDGRRKKKTLKPQYERWRMLSTREGEEEYNKMKRINGQIERAKKKESSTGGEGVSRLTGSPSVLGLPPPSVYRCPAETEGTT